MKRLRSFSETPLYFMHSDSEWRSVKGWPAVVFEEASMMNDLIRTKRYWHCDLSASLNGGT